MKGQQPTCIITILEQIQDSSEFGFFLLNRFLEFCPATHCLIVAVPHSILETTGKPDLGK